MKKSGQKPTILIIEDVDWIRWGMRAALEHHGYRVVEAKSDAGAFALTELPPVDLILTEEQVPRFKELMVRLHKHPVLGSVPVVIINPDAEDGARLGGAYLLADYADIASFLGVVQH